MSKQLNLPQRYAFSALEKRGVSIKECAAEIGCHKSTLYRELKRNATKTGRYNPDKAQEMANERKERIVTNSSLKPGVLREALRLLREEQWSPRQIQAI